VAEIAAFHLAPAELVENQVDVHRKQPEDLKLPRAATVFRF